MLEYMVNIDKHKETCGIAGENRPSGAKTQNELFITCCSPYLALSSGACGASIHASVPELKGETG